jgi:hypothetical protein
VACLLVLLQGGGAEASYTSIASSSMAFYHDPRLQTNLQYHYLPTQELQQQRKQVRR